MKKVSLSKYFILILISILILLTSCSDVGSSNYDNRSFDISLNKDNSLLATSIKSNTDYILKITGKGESRDFSRKENVPWYAISKKIKEVKLEEGITSLGNYLFYSLGVSEIILPKTVNKISKTSTNDKTIIYSYALDILSDSDLNIYYYSETKPSDDKKYFRMVDGKPMIWETKKVLFIGNSFTYRGGSEDNPMVPKYFYDIATSLNIDINIDYVLKGSHTLTKFADVNDKYGAIVEEKLKTNKYDYIILQEQSTTPINSYNNFSTAVGLLKDKIEKYQNNAEIYLYETWGFPELIINKTYKSIKDMESLLFEAYTNCKNEYKLNITYVGQAFTYVVENYPNINLYDSDNKHQSNIGSFLSACSHVASIFDLDIRNSDYIGTLDSVLAKTLKEVAYIINNKYKA